MYGAKITSIRLARGYTQDYMARQIGVDQQSYSRIEKDAKVKVDDELLSKIADALGVSVEDIKSPYPIIMQFHNSPNSGHLLNSNPVYNDPKLIEELLERIKKKDEQVEALIELLKKKS